MGSTNNRVLFVCETKAQIINAVAIKLSFLRNDIVDVCLVRAVAIPEWYEHKLKDLAIFERVFSFEIGYNPKRSFISLVKKTIKYTRLVSIVDNLIGKKLRIYSNVFISGPGSICPAIYYLVRKRCPQIKLSIYEEGICEYLLFENSWNIKRKIYSKLVYGSYYIDDAAELYVYDPKMVLSPPKNIKIIQIPSIVNGSFLIEKINYIFDFKNKEIEEFYKCSFIYFDSCYSDSLLEQNQRNIVESLVKNLGEKLIVKLHPRSNPQKYYKIGVKLLETKQSVELILLNAIKNKKNVDSIVFISLLSSALFNIKLMLNVEPRMILLNNLLGSNNKDDAFSKFAELFVSRYTRNRIFQPKTINELNNILSLEFFSNKK